MGDYGQYIVPTAGEMINFKVGQPAVSMLPLKMIGEAANHKFEETDPMFLQYGHIMGYPKFRKTLSEFLTKGYHHQVDPERLFITNGVTGGLALICSLFLQAGDLVFLEEPSYFLALSIMKDFKLNVRQIRMDQDGLDINALEDLLERGVIPKMLYTIPTCHNPTGRTMSSEKRRRLVELSVKYGFTIIADEVYQLLSFPHVTPPPPMFTFDTHGTVFALGSFSKILAPALRLGWIQAHPRLLKPIIDCGQLDSSGGISPVISGIVHSAIELGHQQTHLDWTTQTLWKRAEVLMTELKNSLPEDVTFEVPDGGYFVLVRLPENMVAADLLPIAMKHKVQFLPGSNFAKTMKNFLRLSFSWYDDQDLALGARRLADAIKEYGSTLDATEGAKKEVVSPSKPQVAVHGASGRLGSLITAELNNGSVATLAGAITRENPSIPAGAQVVVDVTLPEGTRRLLKTLSANPIPLVVGTTGTDLPMEELRQYAQKAPVAVKSNFSVGVPLMTDLVRRVASSVPDDWNVEIAEVHHTKKLDAPSGTAKTLKRAIEATGAPVVGDDGVPCSALRLGDEIGQHTVYFAGPGERIEIKHQATRREVFAIGAVRTAEWILKQPNGLYIV